MYPVVCDSENHIVLKESEKALPSSIRPVFYEKLDLFGLNEYWEYPKCEEPLLWRVNRTYYYRGEAVGRIRGGQFFEKLNLEVYKSLKLEPIDLEKLSAKNFVEKVTTSVVDFIRDA